MLLGKDAERFEFISDFVGVINGKDIYICPQAGSPTIVAREGNRRENYLSGQRLTLGYLTLELNASYSALALRT
mgnify:CR=1 FL=1